MLSDPIENLKLHDARDKKYCRNFSLDDGDQIVISGISGHFPKSHNLTEYEYNLYNKVDMVSEGAFGYVTEFDVPNRIGKIHDVDKFDTTFFGVHYKQTLSMDPQCRIIIETAYEAAIDAGINPKNLRGSRTGVFVGTSYSDSEKAFFYDINAPGNFGITGCSRAMLANRISFTLGLTGPSFLVDGSGSTALQTLDVAYEHLRNGSVDAAIIGGANMILYPQLDVQFNNAGVIAKDGYTRPFDKNASGYNRSEAISCLFLQRKRDAKRIYGYVVHSKTNFEGFRPEGVTYFATQMKEKLLKEFYNDCGIHPNDLGYIEANGVGIPIQDAEECNLIDRVLCNQRSEILPMGSVKSNLGYADAAAGVTALVKVCLALQNGKIPPNINFSEPRTDILALNEGRLKVVTEIEDLEKPYIAINSFNYYGENCHAVLRAHEKEKINFGLPEDFLPRLVCWSGRTEESVHSVIDFIENKYLDSELIGLIHQIQRVSIPSLVFRGYGLFRRDEHEKAQYIIKDVQHYTGIKRPIVWVFSGMGSQWTEMGNKLMGISIFKESIQRCHDVLLSKGLDLIDILTSQDKTIYDNILHSFVGIAAIQIGLVDILKNLEIEPDYIIGHSVGELGCGYADGGFTAEQMILAAYSRGKVSVESTKIVGSMAAIGMGYSAIKKILPQTIEVACHNSSDSCTISGPAEDIAKFVSELKEQNIFAKEVPCSNIAYHSRYISHLGPQLLKYLKEIIPNPKRRSKKWLCSSVPKMEWDHPDSQFCSAEYHTNNLLNSVLFEETALMLPEDSLTIEIAPHGLLQAILKRSMIKAVHIGLTQRGHKNNDHYLIQALGKIYLNGIDMPIDKIYPEIKFPVSKGTANLSSLVKWDHNEIWEVLKYKSIKLDKSSERTIEIKINEEEYDYLKNHIINNRILVPAAYLLEFVANSFAAIKNISLFETSIKFEDIMFSNYLYLTDNNPATLNVMIHRGTGHFAITESDKEIATGVIKLMEETNSRMEIFKNISSNDIHLNNNEFYNEMQIRGHKYSGVFQGIEMLESNGSFGIIKWNNNFAAFLETLFQIRYLQEDVKFAVYPKKIREIILLAKNQHNYSVDKTYEMCCNKNFNSIVCGGIEIVGIQLQGVDKVHNEITPVLKKYEFVPNFPNNIMTTDDVISSCLEIAIESLKKLKIKIVELSSPERDSIISYFSTAIEDIPFVSGKCILLSNKNEILPGVHIQNAQLSNISNCSFLILSQFFGNNKLALQAEKCLGESSFLLSRESRILDSSMLKNISGFHTIATFKTDTESFLLFRKISSSYWKKPTPIKISDSDTKWIKNFKTTIADGPVVLYAENEKTNGILGICNCLQNEFITEQISCVVIDDINAPRFTLNNIFYLNQLKLGLPINILKNGEWGTYRHLNLPKTSLVNRERKHIYAKLEQSCDLSTMNWFEGDLIPNNCDIEVAYSSLNFRDFLLLIERVPINIVNETRVHQKQILGIEFSGIDIKTNKKVMGIVTKGGLSSYIKERSILTWEISNNWTLQEAATIPVAYTLVYYAFFLVAPIRKAKTILIHSGAGSVGFAAIQVAISYGIEVFTTVSNFEKKKFLLKNFPQLKEHHIGTSVDTSFEEMIQEHTNNQGVDYILNSLSGDKLTSSLQCLGKNGQFVEIGKYDILNDHKIGFGMFLKEIGFFSVSLDRLLKNGKESQLIEIKNLINRDIKAGIIKPLHFTVFKANEVQAAFRYISSGQHIGKILVEMCDETKTESNIIKIIPQSYFKNDLIYIVSANFNTFELEFVDWMILRGARNIILHSYNNNSSQQKLHRIRLWKNYGVDITLSSHNITNYLGCEELLRFNSKTIGGIFNLNQIIFEKHESSDAHKISLSLLVDGTKHFDEMSRKFCANLEYFVVITRFYLSSDYQTRILNSMANSIIERIIENRVSDLLPGKVLHLGDVNDFSIAYSKIEQSTNSIMKQDIYSCIENLDELLTSSAAIVSCMVLNTRNNIKEPNILKIISNILGIQNIENISEDCTLLELGLNSLTLMELNNLFKKNYKLDFSHNDLNKMTLNKVISISKEFYKDNKIRDVLTATTAENAIGIAALLHNFGEQRIMSQQIVYNLESNFVEKSSQLLFIPGVEGLAEISINEIGLKLHSKVKVLQFDSYQNSQSIKDIADFAFSSVRNILKRGEKFYLVGYSFGALIALELAALLEKFKYSGNILLIDGAPHFLDELITQKLGKDFSDDDLYNEIFVAIAMQNPLVTHTSDQILQNFISSNTFESKIQMLMQYGEHNVPYTKEYAETMIRKIFTRIKMIVSSTKTNKQTLLSPISLVRPKDISVEDVDEDYRLSKLTKGKVIVQYLDGNHVTIMQNAELAHMINYFDPAKDEKKIFEKYIISGCVLEKDFM